MSERGEEAQQARSGWNASLYDAKHAFVWKYGADLVSLLDPQAGERILDIGCGTGHLTSQIADSGAQVVGVDRSSTMIAAARRSYPNLKFEVADARELHFQDEFDAVFSNATLHWIHQPELVIGNVWKALRPAGRFVAEFGGKGNVRKMQAALDQSLAQIRGAGHDKINPWYYPSISEYATLLERNGLEVRFITLFDRPTLLADGEAGLRNWITMFCSDHLEAVGQESRELFLQKVEGLLRPDLFRNGEWWADYRRLRVVAVK